MVKSKQYLIYLITLATLATIAYLPTFNAGFVYDDHALVEAIEAYRSFDLGQMVLGLGNGLEYLPVRDLSLAVDAAIWGQDPRGYHLSNFIYFMLVLLLMFKVVSALATRLDATRPYAIAFIVTLIFALHPLNTEAVAFVAARNNILALLFILVSAHFFLAASTGRRGGFALSLFAFLLALLSKASAVFYPAALILIYLSLVPFARQRRAIWAALAVLLLMALAAAAMHVVIAGQTGIAQPDLPRYGLNDIRTSLVRTSLVPAFYLRYFLLPWPQSISYDEIVILEWARGWLAIVLYSAYIAAYLLALRFRQQQPLVLVGLCWFYAALIPVSNIFPTFPFVADRYLFPGMPGLALVAAAGLVSIRPHRLRWLLLAALASALLTLTHLRNKDWQSDLSLWQSAWEVTPQTAAHYYFNALVQDGQTEKALTLAAAERPQNYRYALLLCESHYRQSRYDQALPACLEALERSAAYSSAVRQQINLALAGVYEQKEEPFNALHHYLRVMQDNTATARLFFHEQAKAGISRLRSSLAPSELALAEAAASQPQDVRAQGEFGLFLLRTGRYKKAAEQLQRATRLQPENWQISYNLGLAAIHSGDLAMAQNAFQRVPAETAAYAEGLNQLARQFSRRGETATALDYWQQAVAAQPENRNYRYNLARHLLRSGERELARAMLEAGIHSGTQADEAFYRQAMENLGV